MKIQTPKTVLFWVWMRVPPGLHCPSVHWSSQVAGQEPEHREHLGTEECVDAPLLGQEAVPEPLDLWEVGAEGWQRDAHSPVVGRGPASQDRCSVGKSIRVTKRHRQGPSSPHRESFW